MVRYRSQSLVRFAQELFAAAGMQETRALMVAEILVEADLLGHTTHGLELAPRYLDEIRAGAMAVKGDPEIVSDKAAVSVWNGRRLSGVWLTATALEEASRRASDYGIAAVAIRDSHHVACLAAYLEKIARRGQVAILVSSDPSIATVAPFGGTEPVFTPDPIAVGIPTGGDPIMIDMSASITTNGMAGRLAEQGRRFAGRWAQDAAGNPTDDPAVLFGDRKGTLLPAGGMDHGHKGYGMALMVEALSQGLSGGGRSSRPHGWGASVFAMVCEPELFAGLAAFNREMSAIVDLCHQSRAPEGSPPVRLPGERGLRRKRQALAEGLELYPGIMDRLEEQARRLNVSDLPEMAP